MCRVGRRLLDAGLPSKQLGHERGWGAGSKGSRIGDHRLPVHGNHVLLANQDHLFCKCVKWMLSGEHPS